MKDEITRILKLMEEGKLTSQQATDLIDALKSNEEKSKADNQVSNKKKLRVKVLSNHGDNVNVSLPLGFVRSILKLTGSIPIQLDKETKTKIDTQALLDAIDSGYEGKFVDINSSKGDLVEVYIE